MTDPSDQKSVELRVPLVPSWLGADFELVLRDLEFHVSNPGTGTAVRLSPFSFAGRDGCVLRFAERTNHCVDFAGIVWNGVYEFECIDELAARRVAQYIDGITGLKLGNESLGAHNSPTPAASPRGRRFGIRRNHS